MFGDNTPADLQAVFFPEEDGAVTVTRERPGSDVDPVVFTAWMSEPSADVFDGRARGQQHAFCWAAGPDIKDGDKLLVSDAVYKVVGVKSMGDGALCRCNALRLGVGGASP